MGNFNGIYAGKVTSVKDPEKRGRIKVTCAEVLGEEPSSWCEPCMPNAFDKGGDFCLPPIGDYVWIMFEDGEPDQPVYLGGWWSENKTPLGSDYSECKKIRVISFGNMAITLNKGDHSLTINVNEEENECELKVTSDKIKMNVMGSDTELTVTKDKVSIKGKLVVNGKEIS